MTTAETIILNGRVLTMVPEVPRASALAMANGKILAVGSDADIRVFATPQTRVIDAGGRSVLPGFIDSHVHLFQGSAELDFLPVGGLTQLEQVRPKALAYASARPDEPLIQGVGAFYDLFCSATEAPRLMLDKIISDRPFALLAADLHTVWANTAALKQRGMLNGAEMPEGSTVVMGDDGFATGTLLETGAFGPVLALSRTGGRDMLGYVTGSDPEPPATAAEREADKAMLLKGLDHVAAHGITTLHNMDGNIYQLELLSELETEDRLKARVQVPFHLKNFDPLERIEEAADMHRQYQSDMVWSGRVKMFMDGVLESRTGLKIRAYPDDPDNHGEAVFDPSHFNEACRQIDALGLQISVHAVGDMAVQLVLDGYECAQTANGKRDARHRVEHIELITEADIARMKRLDAVASMQPRHAAFAGFFEPPKPDTVFFADECARAYPWEMLRRAGIPLAFSTDWPVVPIDVLANIQCAVTPRNLGVDWPDQSQSLLNSLKAYTATNAWMAFKENHTGSLRAGLAADVVILDADIEQSAPHSVEAVSIAMTFCAGEVTSELRSL
ncbi:amidohydrolase [Roseovarius aestuarii]|uniref:N-substituted formamide deformylase n=1 Tax=Roseovarius aestuarii TaxID=475083 RepID=A0A1X7BY60_9RHOB|nr:amidohydrolase [Roseovarius aestuarii]SMC14551.1 N-substituted formamide deformylase precursor [Roseovarius aestuarii]